ncbi:MAG: cytochrome c [Verrucomicrobia bacterium]|nr:cytochrome c [Verrucomicrobiota bacterium]
MKWKTRLTLIATLALGTWCSQAADVNENWKTHCVSCHGKDGKGETKAGKKAGAKDMTDTKYQADLTDAKAFKQIKEGMKEDGKERMKAFGDKLSDDEIKALIAYVRKFKK